MLSSIPKECFTIILGDFNAKVGQSSEELDGHIGIKLLTASDHQMRHMCDKTFDNRSMFFEFVLKHELWVANTHFEKPAQKLATFRPPGTVQNESQWQYADFFQIESD